MTPKKRAIISGAIFLPMYTFLIIESVIAIKTDSYFVNKVRNHPDRVEYVMTSDNAWKFDNNEYVAVDYYSNGLFPKTPNIDSTNAPNPEAVEKAVRHYLK